jgi:uncharacterized repeat protein (TIGR01451 family)
MNTDRTPQRTKWFLASTGVILTLAALLSFVITLSVGAAPTAAPDSREPAEASLAPPAPVSPVTEPGYRQSPSFVAPGQAPRQVTDKGLEEMQLPGLRLRVNQDHDWVAGRTSPNATVWITVTDHLGAVKGTNQTTAAGNGNFENVYLQDGGGQQADIVPTDVVSARSSDGSTASVAVLTMTGAVNATANIISGQVFSGVFPALVRGEVWTNDGPIVYATTDATGHYVVNFSPFDLQPNTDVFLLYYEPDGDAVGIVRRAFALKVNYSEDWVETTFEAGYSIWITATDSGGAVKATAHGTTGLIPWWPAGQSGFSTILNGWQPSQPDIVPGDWVYGTLGTGETRAARVGTVTGDLDIAQDRIGGMITAAWFTQTLDGQCAIWESNAPPAIDFAVDPNGGTYQCDFSPSGWDVQPGQQVAVSYFEPDRDEILQVFRHPVPDLAVSKQGVAYPTPGGNYVYRIFYQNNEDGGVSGVRITDTLPTSMTYLSDTSGFPHTLDGPRVIWEVGDMPGRANGRFEVFVQVDGGLAVGTIVTNVVEITLPEYDTVVWNNHDLQTTTVSEPDTHLEVSKYAWTDDPAPGQDVVFAVNACNQGSTGSTAVTLTDTLPLSLTLRSWWAQYPGWTAVVSESHRLVVTRPSLPGWWCNEVYVRASLDAAAAPGASIISNTALITASNDMEANDNRADWSGQVNGPHTNLYVGKNWHWGQLVPDGSLSYEIYYNNNGNVPVDGVLITNTLPAHTHFVRSWHATSDSQAPITPTVVAADHIVWAIGTLDNGYRDTIGVELHVDADAVPGATLTNTAQISRQPIEDRDDDNQITWVDTLNAPGPNLRVEKYQGWQNRERIGWELRVINMGDEPLLNVRITDTYPISLTNVNWSRNHGPNVTDVRDDPNHRLALLFDRLEVGETAGIGLWGDVAGGAAGVPGLIFTNTLDAPYPGDVYAADNAAEAVTFSGPDLQIAKRLSGGEPRAGELLTYTLRFTNTGGWTTEGTVWVTDTLPAGVEFVSAVQRNCGAGIFFCARDPDRQDGPALGWMHGTWSPGSWNEIVITVRVGGTVTAGDPLTNTATIASDSPLDVEPYYDNNTSEVVVVVAGSKVYLPMVRR